MREDDESSAEDCELSNAPAKPPAHSLPLIVDAARTNVTVAAKTAATAATGAMKATSSAVGRIPSGAASSHWSWERKNLQRNRRNMR